MRKLGTVLVILILSGMVAAPVLAGPGHSGWYYCPYGYGPGNSGLNPYEPGITSEQNDQVDKLTKAFFDETNELRKTLWTKSHDLDAIMAVSAPDEAKAMALQKEISDIKATLSQKRIQYQISVKKIIPEASFVPSPGPRYGRGPAMSEGYTPPIMGDRSAYEARSWGRGYRPPMRDRDHGYGYGPPMRDRDHGYGYGPCWY